MVASKYEHVPANEYGEEDDGVELTAGADNSSTTTATALSLSSSSFNKEESNQDDDDWLTNTVAKATQPSAVATLFTMPLLLTWMILGYEFTGRLWGMWPFVLHLHLRLGVSRWHFDSGMSIDNVADRHPHPAMERRLTMACSSIAFLDIVLFGLVYPIIGFVVIKIFFTDVDGSFHLEWKHLAILLMVLAGMGMVMACLRLGVCAVSYYHFIKNKRNLGMCSNGNQKWCPTIYMPSIAGSIVSETTQQRIAKSYQLANMSVSVLHILCLFSVLSHFGPWPDVPVLPEECNPLDSTLCALPFPSFHHLQRDNATHTGWRVHLKGLPPLRGGIPLHPKFLNELDGFSTMAPILFYLDGLKEVHEAAASTKGNSTPGLQGPEHITKSVTNESITLLINVDERVLVPHSSEIDYLDARRPLVMMIPARPLRHNTHYAVAVVNALGVDGHRLPRSQGLRSVLEEEGDSPTHIRFVGAVLPALGQAAPWVDFDNDPESVQLLFDFVTISEENQLGPTRRVRDGMLAHVGEWKWEDHVELASEVKNDCSPDGNNLIARTYHITLDVPTFLKRQSRYSVLDHAAVESGAPISVSKAKAMIRIPCSVERAALGYGNGKSVKAIVEYGHGLFNQRDEMTDGFLSRMANDEGYILMAMDWRGMSRSDLPVVIKTLIGNPNHFQSMRDNLIQGYSNKLALQHFSRNGMLNWLKINGANLPTDNAEQPTSVFYGISQGGILGGGYLALSSSTTLIDRGVLGSPGTPFAAALTRSLDFYGYDILILFNLYNNRHVRLLLSLLQMGWDSVEVSGLLAPPSAYESLPPILLQTGLGDVEVPTIACEGMARAMNASTLPHNPRSIYGVPVADETESQQPNVVLTEIMYEKEYASLPIDDTRPERNKVHFCVRWDSSMIGQIVEFVNTGQFTNPCDKDQCHRPFATRC